MKRINCAIYTRKSSDEGLEQEFNSLDAQREACEAYIKSQKQQGWACLPEMFDDGGLSGGTMDRPALKRLLIEIEAGRVHTIVVYKVDRLTRSLADFAKIVDILDAAGASFVSVTQQFNTTTSMGRLTLNMLLSFAQFEREIAGERIRDKIRASKAKGMWMGGTVPLGYAAIDKKLVIAENEAATVRMVFERYLEVGSVSNLRSELDAKGIVGRKPQGADRPGPRFGRGALYTLLSNPVYRGKVRHGDELYDGRHDAIIGQDIWDRTQGLLAENRQAVRRGDAAKAPSLLSGLILDADGDRMTATHSSKSGRRYRYYVSSRLITEKRSASPTAMRVPAGDIETLVLSRLRQLLVSTEEIGSALAVLSLDAMQIEAAIARGSEIAANCIPDRSTDAAHLVKNIVERIEVSETLTTLMIKCDALASELGVIPLKASTESASTITLRIEATLRRAGRGKRLVLGNAIADQRNDALINLVARALATRERLLSGEVESVQQMSEGSGRSREQTTRLMRLSYLAPDIVRAILDGHQPVGLTVKALMVAAKDLPTRWDAQLKMLGFRHASPEL